MAVTNNPISVTEPVTIQGVPVPTMLRGRDRIAADIYPQPSERPQKMHTTAEVHLKKDTLIRQNGTLRSRVGKLSEVILRVTGSLDLDTVLQEVVDGACSLTDARYGALSLFDDSCHVRQFVTSVATPDEKQLLEDLSLQLDEIREPIRLADLASHFSSVGSPEDHLPMKTLLATPIRHQGEQVGNICLTEKESGETFTEDDEETLELIASQAAVAIRNALRYEGERQARAELETEKRRLEALVESSPVGVMVVDAATRTFASVNQEAERILGMSPEPGTTLVRYHEVAIYRRTDGEMYEGRERPLARALDKGEVVRAEEILLDRPGGGTTLVLVNATPIYSDDGKIVSAVAVLQDMTPLEELERQRNEFLAMVSHELRTPLTTIIGCTSVVLRSPDPLHISELLQYFRMIDEQSGHLRDLVNNLLDMTRIEAGALSVTPKPTDLNVLVEEAKTAFLRRGERNTVDVDLDPDLPLIEADARRIAQVLNNLLSNASKYSPETSTIGVTALWDDLHVAVSVTDEGRGIPSEQLDKLFRKFSRLDDEGGQRKVAGEGLGLAICKGIVEVHGGRIWAESEGEGLGTRITFTIPVASSEAPEISGDAPVATVADRYRVLAVDDEPQMLWLLGNILSDQGYKLVGASNPDEMVRQMETEKPHLVLLDLMLPGTSGFELMTRIREVSDVPIIFVSANDQEENVVKALSMGADDYVVKPFSSTELLARVASSLRKRRAEGVTVPRQPYRLGDLTIDYADRLVTVSGRPVRLSATEYKLLYELSISAGRVLTQDQILELVWGLGYSGGSELLRSAVRNLRRKLGDDANDPKYVFTEPRVGYRMEKPSR